MRGLALSLWLIGAALPVAARAQTQEPQLQVTFEEAEAIPGQMLSLRLTVLVPTFLPSPPVWPSLEAPNLLVRLPEGATGPTSARIDGETWAGVTRNYRLSPMVPGTFEIPAQQVIVTYADPETSDPVKVTLSTEPFSLIGVVPEGAEELDPFIAATALTLTQDIDGEPEALTPGGSVRRTVTARIAGTSPMFLPALLPPPTQIDGVASYADEPVMEETADRGTLGGTRVESVSYVAEGGGHGTAPAVSVDWYNLDSGQVETASVDGFDLVVEGPPARTEDPRGWRVIGMAVAAALLLLGLLWLGARRLWPVLRRQGTALLARWHGSERYAYGQLRRVVSRRDHAALRPALDDWAKRVDGADPRQQPDLATALTRIGAARYGRGGTDEARAWQDLADALPAARRSSRQRTASADGLPPLNPS